MNKLPKNRKVVSFVNAKYRDEILKVLEGCSDINITHFDSFETRGEGTLTPELADFTLKAMIENGSSVFALSVSTKFDTYVVESAIKLKAEGADIMIIIVPSMTDMILYSINNNVDYSKLVDQSDKVLYTV